MGKPKFSKKPDKETLLNLYVKQSKSIRAVAEELSLHADTVHYWLEKYGIKTRSKARKSQLIHIPLEEIEGNIKELGIRGDRKSVV